MHLQALSVNIYYLGPFFFIFYILCDKYYLGWCSSVLIKEVSFKLCTEKCEYKYWCPNPFPFCLLFTCDNILCVLYHRIRLWPVAYYPTLSWLYKLWVYIQSNKQYRYINLARNCFHFYQSPTRSKRTEKELADVGGYVPSFSDYGKLG